MESYIKIVIFITVMWVTSAIWEYSGVTENDWCYYQLLITLFIPNIAAFANILFSVFDKIFITVKNKR